MAVAKAFLVRTALDGFSGELYEPDVGLVPASGFGV